MSFAQTGLQAQTKEAPVITYLDQKRNPLQYPLGYLYIEAMWPEGAVWKAELYDAADKLLREEYYYKSSDRKEKHGIFQSFYSNGMTRDSGL